MPNHRIQLTYLLSLRRGKSAADAGRWAEGKAMASDTIAEMAPLVREVLSADAELCASFEVTGRTDAWLQVMRGTLNFAYPRTEEPTSAIGAIVRALPDTEIIAWEANKFATVSFGPARPQLVAMTADRVFSELFGFGDYAVDGAIEEMG